MANNKNQFWVGLIILALTIMIFQNDGKKEATSSSIARGGGMGEGGFITSQKTAVAGSTIRMGKYHEASFTGSSPASVPSQTSFDLAEYPLGYTSDASFYAKVIGESKSESKSEIPIVIVNLGRITNGGTVNIDWYHPDGRKIYSFSKDIPSPQSKGYEYWNWYSIWSWIGYFEHEIDRYGLYKAKITTSWGNEEISFAIIDSDSINNKCYTNAQCFDGTYTCANNRCGKICVPDWSCTSWSPSTCPLSGVQTKACTDDNNCGINSGKPATSQSCTYTPGAFCPSVCVPMYKIENNACIYKDCGSGCGPDGISTFGALAQCNAALGGTQSCSEIKSGILSLINAWANNPSSSGKSQILTKMNEWAGKC